MGRAAFGAGDEVVAGCEAGEGVAAGAAGGEGKGASEQKDAEE